MLIKSEKRNFPRWVKNFHTILFLYTPLISILVFLEIDNLRRFFQK